MHRFGSITITEDQQNIWKVVWKTFAIFACELDFQCELVSAVRQNLEFSSNTQNKLASLAATLVHTNQSPIDSLTGP